MCNIRKKLLIQSSENLVKDGQTDFGTDNKPRVKHPLKHLTLDVFAKTCSSCFLFLQKSFILDV